MTTSPVLAAHCVYRALDANDQVLYIGSTSGLRRRFWAHRSNSPWFGRCTSVEWTEHATERDARVEEYRLIRELRPPFNKHGLPKSHAA